MRKVLPRKPVNLGASSVLSHSTKSTQDKEGIWNTVSKRPKLNTNERNATLPKDQIHKRSIPGRNTGDQQTREILNPTSKWGKVQNTRVPPSLPLDW
jgi:hypothetical protein